MNATHSPLMIKKMSCIMKLLNDHFAHIYAWTQSVRGYAYARPIIICSAINAHAKWTFAAI